jgi:transposase
LKYSRWIEVSLVPDERVETLVRALVEHVAAFGGIPLVTVFDRPKTIALKWGRDGVVTEWNPTFAGVVLDLGVGVEVCSPYRPQEKGSVESRGYDPVRSCEVGPSRRSASITRPCHACPIEAGRACSIAG